MILSKLFRNMRAKALVALVGVTMVLGVGAAISAGVAQKENEVVETKATAGTTLYFVPPYAWGQWSYSGKWQWPKLSLTHSGGTYEAWADGITGVDEANSTTYQQSARQVVWVFQSVPHYTPTQISFKFNADLNDSPVISYDSSTSAKWYTSGGVQEANVFGSPDGSDWNYSDQTACGLYAFSKSKTMIMGSFVEHPSIEWNRWPFSYSVLTGSSKPYSIQLDVDLDDACKFATYEYLRHKTGTNDGGWELYNVSDWLGYSDGNITLYVGNTKITDADTISEYIYKADNGNIVFQKCGTVQLLRETDDREVYTLTVKYLTSASRTPAATEDEPDYIRGTFNNWSGSMHPISFNPDRGRFEAIVGAFQGDKFKFTYGNDGWITLSTAELDQFNDATVAAESGVNPDLYITSDTGFYVFGYYFTNDGGTRTRTIFIDKLYDVVSTEAAAEALCLRITLYETCEMSNENALALKDLHDACTYASLETYMSSYDITDYSYEDWKSAGESYSGLTKTYETNAKDKYDWLLYVGGVTHVRPSSAGAVPYGSGSTESPLTTTLWIVLASGLAGLVAIGTAYFVSKKKKRPQA